jgi:CheY-like chemotaxis protein/anti-sigma regulatory factor (Ser/Thr protein kinase)
MELVRSLFAVQSAITDVQNIAKALANKKKITLLTEVDPELPKVLADQSKFKQVLYNLLSNAVKFTPEGGTVTVSAEVVESSLRVSVSDTGIGIQPEYHERIFGEFEQVDSSYARQQQGTGLGLALTRKLVELHGGRIWVESDGVEGRGSKFTFVLPLERDKKEAGPEEANGLLRPQVLLFEQFPTDHSISNYLQHAGYAVTPVSNCSEALQKAADLAPYALLVSPEVPEPTVDELLSLLGASAAADRLPVVRTYFEQNTLRFALLSMDQGTLKSRARLSEAITRGTNPSSREVRTVLVVDDEPLMVEILGRFLQQAGFKVLRAFDGETAIQLAQENEPDLLILDLKLPQISGFDVVERLRADPKTQPLPIIVHTGMALTEQQRNRLAHQLLTVLPKFNRESLFQHLGSFTAGKTADQRN